LNDYFHLKTFCPNGLGFAPAWWYPIVFGFAFIFVFVCLAVAPGFVQMLLGLTVRCWLKLLSEP